MGPPSVNHTSLPQVTPLREPITEASRPTQPALDSIETSCCSCLFEAIWAPIRAILNYFGFCLSKGEDDDEVEQEQSPSRQSREEIATPASTAPPDNSSSIVLPTNLPRRLSSSISDCDESSYDSDSEVSDCSECTTEGDDGETSFESESVTFSSPPDRIEGTPEYACANWDLAALKECEVNAMKASTLLFVAIERLTQESQEEDFTRATEILDYLFERGAFVNTANRNRESLMTVAITHKLSRIVSYLTTKEFCNGTLLVGEQTKKTAKKCSCEDILTILNAFEKKRQSLPQVQEAPIQNRVPNIVRTKEEQAEKLEKQRETAKNRRQKRLQLRQESAYFQFKPSHEAKGSSNDEEPLRPPPNGAPSTPVKRVKRFLASRLGIGRRPEES